MRDIKFRGLSEGKWYYGLLTFMFGSYAIVDPKDENTVHLVDVKTVGQYAELRDFNDVEMHEGDIGWDDHQECYGVVKFDEGKFIYEWENVSDDLWEVKDNIEIVGNIYDNPELLERD